MLVNDYTLPELVDLALRVPEIGAVNFNILHTVLQAIIEATGLQSLRPWCEIKYPEACRNALIKAGGSRTPGEDYVVEKDDVSSSEEVSEDTVSTDEKRISEDLVDQTEGTSEKQPEERKDEPQTELPKEREVEPTKEPEVEPPKEREIEKPKVEPPKERKFEPPKDRKVEPPKERKEPPRPYRDHTEESPRQRRKEVPEKSAEEPAEEEAPRRFLQPEFFKEAPNMTQIWQASNVTSRVKAAEESIDKIAVFLDKMNLDIKDALLKMSAVDQIHADFADFEDELNALRDEVAAKDDAMSDIMSRLADVEANKADKEEIMEMMQARLESQEKGEEQIDLLNQKMEDMQNIIERLAKLMGIDLKDLMSMDFDQIQPAFQKVSAYPEEAREEKPVTTTARAEMPKEQERLLHSVAARADIVDSRLESLENEKLILSDALEQLRNTVNDLQYDKVDNETFQESLAAKADKIDLDHKVGKDEFEAMMEEVNDSIDDVNDRIKLMDEERRLFEEKTERELKLKLSIVDYQTLQIPLQNRIRALMYAFKKMKEIVRSTQCPDAAGITKCVSCARSAELADKPAGGDAGGQYVEYGTLPQNAYPSTDGDDVRSSSARDDSDNNSSGSKAMVTEIDLTPDATAVVQNIPVGLAHRKPKIEIDYELEKLMRVGKLRSCGGKHTMTTPQQRGIKTETLWLPTSTAKKGTLVGYDHAWYRGSFKSRPVDGINDMEGINEMDAVLLSIGESCDDLPPRKGSYYPSSTRRATKVNSVKKN